MSLCRYEAMVRDLVMRAKGSNDLTALKLICRLTVMAPSVKAMVQCGPLQWC